MSDPWTEYVESYKMLLRNRMALQAGGDALVAAVNASLLGGGWECAAALSYVPFLRVEEALSLLPSLLSVAIQVHGQTVEAWDTLRRLPREPVLEAVSELERDVMARRESEEYACLMQLWLRLDRDDRAKELADRARTDADPDVREAGEAFLSGARVTD